MKTAIRIMAAGLAASLALVSCAKQDVIDNGSANPAGGARTIAVSFANASVKSALGEDGLTPKFVANDVIKVSNGTDAPVDCTVEIDGSGNASITTELTGALTMVYPAAAAKMNGNAIEGVLVPTVQDGKFASANICKAIIAEKATEASFENQTALFKVTPPDGIKKFTITSLKPIVGGARTGTAVAINTEGADDAAKLVITVGGDASELTTFYVSFVAGANLTDLSFEYKTDETHGAMKGIPAKSIQAPVVDKTATSTLYTIDANNWHDYVVLAGKKWATMNIGATKPKDYGEYFAWGETTGHKANSAKTGFENDYRFDWSHTPFNNGQSDYDETYFNSVKDTECPGGILALKNDAANVNWGGSWRMPTDAEFEALCAIDKAWDDSKKGYTFGVSPAQIFLPAAGFGNGSVMSDAGVSGYYWSSSLDTDYPDYAYVLYFSNGNVNSSSSFRYSGQSVRPFSE